MPPNERLDASERDSSKSLDSLAAGRMKSWRWKRNCLVIHTVARQANFKLKKWIVTEREEKQSQIMRAMRTVTGWHVFSFTWLKKKIFLPGALVWKIIALCTTWTNRNFTSRKHSWAQGMVGWVHYT